MSETNSSARDAVGAEGSNPGRRRVVIAAVAAVVVIAVACGGVFGYRAYAAGQEAKAVAEMHQRNYDASVAAAEEKAAGYQSQVDALRMADGMDRAARLDGYAALKSLKTQLLADIDAGAFGLYGGFEYDTEDLRSSLDDAIVQARDWFTSDYSARLANNALAQDASADNVTREDAQAKVDALSLLLADMGNEIQIWPAGTAEDAGYVDLLGKVNAEADRAKAIVAELDKRDIEAKAAANGKTVSSINADGSITYADGSVSYDGGNTYSGGSSGGSYGGGSYSGGYSDSGSYSGGSSSSGNYNTPTGQSPEEYWGVTDGQGVIDMDKAYGVNGKTPAYMEDGYVYYTDGSREKI